MSSRYLLGVSSFRRMSAGRGSWVWLSFSAESSGWEEAVHRMYLKSDSRKEERIEEYDRHLWCLK